MASHPQTKLETAPERTTVRWLNLDCGELWQAFLHDRHTNEWHLSRYNETFTDWVRRVVKDHARQVLAANARALAASSVGGRQP